MSNKRRNPDKLDSIKIKNCNRVLPSKWKHKLKSGEKYEAEYAKYGSDTGLV